MVKHTEYLAKHTEYLVKLTEYLVCNHCSWLHKYENIKRKMEKISKYLGLGGGESQELKKIVYSNYFAWSDLVLSCTVWSSSSFMAQAMLWDQAMLAKQVP